MSKELYDPSGNKLIDIPKEIKTKSFVVIDSDYIAFKVAAILENKHVLIYDYEDKLIGQYKNRTEFKKSKDFVSEYKVEDCQNLKPGYNKTMVYLLKQFIEDIRKACDVSEVVMAASSPTNFRDRIPSPQKYKGNRDNAIKPLALKECKEYLTSNYITVRPEDAESDDIVAMFQFRSYYDKEYKIIAVTPDKDSLQVNGYLYNPESTKGMASHSVELIEGFGSVQLVQKSKKNKLTFKGRLALYCQLLHGDSTDNYDPSYWHKEIKGISTKSSLLTDLKTYNLLKDCKNDKEALKVVHDQYYEWYKDLKEWTSWEGKKIKGDYLDLLQCYWDYAFMLRFPADKVCVRTVLKNLEVI